MSSEKVFSGIENEYSFFASHSTEAARILKRLSTEPFLSLAKQATSILDFGGGDGEFTESFVQATGARPARLALVEPTDSYRPIWKQRLSKTLSATLDTYADDTAPLTDYDLALSNHVLYYVHSLERSLRFVCGALTINGSAIVTLAQATNALIQIWNIGFSKGLGIATPYHSAADLERTLKSIGTPFEKTVVESDLSFIDSKHNRTLLLRFLFKDHLGRMSSIGIQAIDAFLNQASKNGHIRLPLTDGIYLIRRSVL